jgi:FixJ family two-component response regulator
MTESPIIYIIDDDDAVRAGLKLLLESEGFQIEHFASAVDFYRSCPEDCACRGCIILDLQMPDIDGLSVQKQLHERGISMPIIFLSGHGTVPTAVQALQDGAMDFIEKPVDQELLLECVRRALQNDLENFSRVAQHRVVEQRLKRLTQREREIMDMIAAGKPNKLVALELGISERTVELHRPRILQKMEVKNAAELAQLISSSND